jgi:hypothetical protein
MKLHKISITCGSILAMALLAPMASHAQYVLGSFQGPTDPTDAGWIDANNSDSITTDPNASFVAAGVPGYPLSLQMSGPGGFGNPSALELQFSAAQKAAFNANSYLAFTFSLPASSATGGYNQIYNLVFNAPGYGYNNFMSGSSAAATWGTYSTATGNTGSNQNGEPNFYLYSGYSLMTETVVVNYSSILPAIMAGGESYLQMQFQGNTGGGSPNIQDFNNVELLPAPEPSSMALAGLGGILGMFVIRRRKS